MRRTVLLLGMAAMAAGILPLPASAGPDAVTAIGHAGDDLRSGLR